MTVEVALVGDRLVTTTTDDGVGFDGDAPSEGNGLRNLRRRASEIGGVIRFSRRDRGMTVRIEAPLDASVRFQALREQADASRARPTP